MAGVYVNSNKLAFIAKKDGLECPFLRLNNDLPFLGAYVTLTKMESDVGNSISLFKELIQQKHSIQIQKALTNEAIISYSRPFKRSNNRTIKKLLPVELGLNVEELEIHNKLMLLRDKFFAHSDINEYEDVFVLLALESAPKSKGIIGVYRGIPTTATFSHESYVEYLSVSEKVLAFIKDLIALELGNVMLAVQSEDLNWIYEQATDPTLMDSDIHKVYLNHPWD